MSRFAEKPPYLQLAVADGGNTGVDLRRHRGAHNLLGTGQCRRLAKLVPNLAADNGTAALLNHPFVEWLAGPIIFPGERRDIGPS